MEKNRAAPSNAKMKRKEYERELRKLQVELCHLQDWIKTAGGRVFNPY
jgi:polyphosphate kinase